MVKPDMHKDLRKLAKRLTNFPKLKYLKLDFSPQSLERLNHALERDKAFKGNTTAEKNTIVTLLTAYYGEVFIRNIDPKAKWREASPEDKKEHNFKLTLDLFDGRAHLAGVESRITARWLGRLSLMNAFLFDLQHIELILHLKDKKGKKLKINANVKEFIMKLSRKYKIDLMENFNPNAYN